jgi:hypothetical protein
MGLLALVRADAIVLSGLLWLLAVTLTPRQHWPRLVASLPLVVGPFLLHLGWRLASYGDWLPLTAHLKVLNWSDRWLAGLGYLAGCIVIHWGAVLALFIGMPSRQPGYGPLRNRLLLFCLASTAYIVWIGGDAFAGCRFLLPLLPIILTLAVLAVQEVVTHPAGRRLGVVLCLLGAPLVVPAHLTPASQAALRGNLHLGLTLRATMPPDTVVADTWAGSPFYFSHLRGVDLLGKTDPLIATLPADGLLPGHNKFDITASLTTHRPDLVIGTWPQAVPLLDGSDRAWDTAIQQDATFQAHCRHPLPLRTWRTVYVCDWSPLFRNPKSEIQNPKGDRDVQEMP